MVDVRGPRFSSAVTATLLVAALVVGGTVGTALVALQVAVFAVAVALGVHRSPWAGLFRLLRRTLRLGPPPALESAVPVRFAQACGLVVSSLGLGALLVGAPTLGRILVGVVVALATLLAATGICLGCELWLVGARARRTLTSGRWLRPGSARGDDGPTLVGPASNEVAPASSDDGAGAQPGSHPWPTRGLAAVLFTTPTCRTCPHVRAELLAVAGARAELAVVEVDAAARLDLADLHRVRRAPTIVFLDDGVEFARRSGAIVAADIDEVVTSRAVASTRA